LYFNKKFEKKNDKELNRLFLHSSRLCFEDLEYNKKCFESKLPEELINFLKCSKDF
jgi:23S rRNA-/tRNA-specific pseudouridylate synthase